MHKSLDRRRQNRCIKLFALVFTRGKSSHKSLGVDKMSTLKPRAEDLMCPSCSISHKISKSDSSGGEPVICDSAQHSMGGLATPYTNHQQHTNMMSTANHSVSKYRNQAQKLEEKQSCGAHQTDIGRVGWDHQIHTSRLPRMIRDHMDSRLYQAPCQLCLTTSLLATDGISHEGPRFFTLVQPWRTSIYLFLPRKAGCRSSWQRNATKWSSPPSIHRITSENIFYRGSSKKKDDYFSLRYLPKKVGRLFTHVMWMQDWWFVNHVKFLLSANCTVNETQYWPGQRWKPDACTDCVCNNGTALCRRMYCRIPDCPFPQVPIVKEGICCPFCPPGLWLKWNSINTKMKT